MIKNEELLLMVKDSGFLLYDAGYGPEVLHTEPLRYSQKCFERFAEMVIDHYRSFEVPYTGLNHDLSSVH